MTRDRRRALLALASLAVIAAAVSFVFWATRPVPHGECVVAFSRVSTGDSEPASGLPAVGGPVPAARPCSPYFVTLGGVSGVAAWAWGEEALA
ncbi:hypothetical protein [Streptomyces sp. NPDC057740]|uniref:hypothetical protein n=1 Tax=Streptomyces sp. NPDC057740 TaxID=3346234 RepID=UPI0036B65DFF